MYNGINLFGNNNINNQSLSSLSSNSDVNKILSSNSKIKELYSSSYNFIDESEISTEAIDKLNKELDIKKFSKIVFSESNSVLDDLKCQTIFDEESLNSNFNIFDKIVNNKKFLEDLFDT